MELSENYIVVETTILNLSQLASERVLFFTQIPHLTHPHHCIAAQFFAASAICLTNMDEVYFQYLHQLAIESPMFRKWRNLQNGEIYKYDRIEHHKPEDEDKLLNALRGASARHHR